MRYATPSAYLDLERVCWTWSTAKKTAVGKRVISQVILIFNQQKTLVYNYNEVLVSCEPGYCLISVVSSRNSFAKDNPDSASYICKVF